MIQIAFTVVVAFTIGFMLGAIYAIANLLL